MRAFRNLSLKSGLNDFFRPLGAKPASLNPQFFLTAIQLKQEIPIVLRQFEACLWNELADNFL